MARAFRAFLQRSNSLSYLLVWKRDVVAVLVRSKALRLRIAASFWISEELNRRWTPKGYVNVTTTRSSHSDRTRGLKSRVSYILWVWLKLGSARVDLLHAQAEIQVSGRTNRFCLDAEMEMGGWMVVQRNASPTKLEVVGWNQRSNERPKGRICICHDIFGFA